MILYYAVMIFKGILFFVIFSINVFYGYTQEIIEVNKLKAYNLVAGPGIGYGGQESEQWKLYRIIKEKYSSDIIEKEYYNTDSVIAKIYLYWILRENKWQNIIIVYNDLMNYKDNCFYFSPDACIVFSEPVELERIVNHDYNKYYNQDICNYEYDSKNIYFEFSQEIQQEIQQDIFNKIILEYFSELEIIISDEFKTNTGKEIK